MTASTQPIPVAQHCRILLVEDDDGDAGLVRWSLRKQAELDYELERVDSLAGCLSACAERPFDIILLDLFLPESSGLDSITRVADECPGPAIIVVTGLDDREMGLQAVQAGAQDYLVKQHMDPHELCRAIRYAMERKLSRDYLVALREEFLAHVSHELRTPLTAATGALELLREDGDELGAPTLRLLNMAHSNLLLLGSMVADLIDTTVLRTGKLRVNTRPMGVGDLVESVVEGMTPIAQRASVELVDVGMAGGSTVQADRGRILQVLINLTANAITHTPAGGRVTVETLDDPSRPGFLTFAVSDTGCGISEAALPHLFERLYRAPEEAGTRSRNGLGLGLYIADELVREHGGEIWAESVLDQGSRFVFTLPLAGSVALAASSPLRAPELTA